MKIFYKTYPQYNILLNRNVSLIFIFKVLDRWISHLSSKNLFAQMTINTEPYNWSMCRKQEIVDCLVINDIYSTSLNLMLRHHCRTVVGKVVKARCSNCLLQKLFVRYDTAVILMTSSVLWLQVWYLPKTKPGKVLVWRREWIMKFHP